MLDPYVASVKRLCVCYCGVSSAEGEFDIKNKLQNCNLKKCQEIIIIIDDICWILSRHLVKKYKPVLSAFSFKLCEEVGFYKSTKYKSAIISFNSQPEKYA